MKTRQSAPRRRVLKHWHMIFGTFLHMRMEPVQIQVQVEVQAAKAMPKLDIVLLRPEGQENWSEEQRALLPDGLRSCGATRIMLEFKYTESFGIEAVRQTLAYDWLYRKSEHLADHQLRAFLICSMTPSAHRLEGMGYQPTDCPGVYRSCNDVCRNVDIISLNELSDEPQNLAFKLFASRKEVREHTADTLMARSNVSDEVVYFLQTLRMEWQEGGGQRMITSMTKEEILEYGRQLTLASLANIPDEDRLEGISTSKRLQGIPARERLQGLTDDELRELLNSDARLRILLSSEQNQAG